ncbi:unnamed protein product [Allacma fusca]|uniref:Peptidase S1 domain-containing protein n=1 Tax=Allacma fusca TaxID=39272 RepID=A0A8J2JB68_9HEXA|nr:unnamed protein product [Allacma fusca]
MNRKVRNSGWAWPASTSETKGKDERKINVGKKEVVSTVKKEPRSGFTFGIFSTTTPILTTGSTARPATTATANCTCVPYYYCDEGQVVSDGSGVIDIRLGWPCTSILQVCCRTPRPIPSTVAPVPGVPTVAPVTTSTAIPGFTPRCGTLNPNGINARILGFKDNEAQFGEYPWMAAILEKKIVQGRQVNYFVCGGSLIWPSVILTAAHCVHG